MTEGPVAPAAIEEPDEKAFLIDWGLYRVHKTADPTKGLVRRLRQGILGFDAYCVNCSQSATFRPGARSVEPPKPPRSLGNGFRPDVTELPPEYFTVRMFCARASHPYTFYIQQKGDELRKVGQWPSYGDIQVGEMGDSIKVLNAADRRELVKAVRLYSSDAAVGAFAYLRRPFERLVSQARERRIAESGDIDGYDRMRMPDRIKALAGFLPKIMTSNAGAYGVLSKGLHELSEEDCETYFPVVRLAIGRMLEEEAHRRRAEREDSDMTKALQGIVGKIGKAEPEPPAARGSEGQAAGSTEPD